MGVDIILLLDLEFLKDNTILLLYSLIMKSQVEPLQELLVRPIIELLVKPIIELLVKL